MRAVPLAWVVFMSISCGRASSSPRTPEIDPSGNVEHLAKSRCILPRNGRFMDRLEAMSIVLAVAETGSLSAAARQKKTPLATVSRKVSELEAHLQTKLFNRSSRVLVPTDAGRSYIAAAKRILADVAEAERAASGEYTTPRGELTVSAPVTLGRVYLPVLAEFLAAFPEVDVQLDLRD